MEIVGYLAAVLIGGTLGLTGSGGSILTVPILVYLIGLNPVIATSYSLFVVGATSSIGGMRFLRKGLVHGPTLVMFGVPSVLTIYLTRLYLMPALPHHLFELGKLKVTKEEFVMVLFAFLMVGAACRMIQDRGHPIQFQNPKRPHYLLVCSQAVLVGLISGLVGAGGGFLIIPALVLLLRLDMKTAVGTSLVLIAGNSLVGFLGDMFHYSIDWGFLLTFSGLSGVGIWAGAAYAHKINSKALKKGFGWFVLCMGVFILLKEIQP
ncbi:sulfite exporter TauE/SafE family protein [Rufibacter latericius]|uniref:Probable membrane transporter protein n=1 Tax=Rufibacter latericius TaxID=2487040 RepID=A0A3M9MVW5_9BACT|nr:sulfite exporter TauE/SafE family protein [Rufibacter latericius]RNI29315.1 sulfite exporter TauE/SafE family protein [Rufibacter latericius]